MGMYDEITCDYELPEVGVVDWCMQTKSLNCLMSHFHIEQDGRLILKHDSWHNDFKEVNRTFADFTGEIRFYGGPDFARFSAYFVEGRLREIHKLREPA